MKVNEFFTYYANVPLDRRFQIVNMALFGTMTLAQAYQRLNELEEKIRPFMTEEQSILDEVERLKLLPSLPQEL